MIHRHRGRGLAEFSDTHRKRSSRPPWLWRKRHILSGFVFFVGIGIALGALQHAPARTPAQASATDNILGWAWSDVAGWISMNSDNANACPSGSCGTYGVNVDPVSRKMLGFGWSDTVGWICFGGSCQASPACSGADPTGGVNTTATIGNNGLATTAVTGWAKVCNLGDAGWISLNCSSDPTAGACTVAAPYYHVAFNPSTGFFADSLPNSGASFGWNYSTTGKGLGYVDFQKVYLRTETPIVTPPGCTTNCTTTGGGCTDGIDNNLNGLIDCQETSCGSSPNCAESTANNNCNDGIDNDFNGTADCKDVKCATAPNCAETSINNNCHDSVDNDVNGQFDCQDSKCIATDATCAPAGWESNCALGTTDKCCSDGMDNSTLSDGKIDCADTSCQQNAPICTPAWLQAKYGNVYAQQGIIADVATGAPSKSKASYCLTSKGTITGVQSDRSCVESGSSQSISLPSITTNYQGTLGTLDIKGILSGRYGIVIPFIGALPNMLGGKVYYATGDVTLSATSFQNGTLQTEIGTGLLIVEGGNLTITGNLGYASQSLSQHLKNLASFGVIVKKKVPNGPGGSIIIQPGVTQIVGAYFAEDTFQTATNGADQPLQVLGMVAAHKFNLQRNYRNVNTPAETFVFDGRASVNPPPGMQDVSKTLPTTNDAY